MGAFATITAFQDTQQSSSTGPGTWVTSNCTTAALLNGKRYLVFYCGNHGFRTAAGASHMRLLFGAITYAWTQAFGRGGASSGESQTAGWFIVTGDGSSTLKFEFQFTNATSGTFYCAAMGIIAIQIDDYTDPDDNWRGAANGLGLDIWYTQENGDTFTTINAPTGSWTVHMTKTINVPRTADYLVLFAVECNAGDVSADRARTRVLIDGVNMDGVVQRQHAFKDPVSGGVACTYDWTWSSIQNIASGAKVFKIEVRSAGGARSDWRRGRIMLIRADLFEQYVSTKDTTGGSTTSNAFQNFINHGFAPNQDEDVLTIFHACVQPTVTLKIPFLQINNSSDATVHRVDGGQGHVRLSTDANPHAYFPSMIMALEALTAAGGSKTYRGEYRNQFLTGSPTTHIGQTPFNHIGQRTELMSFGLTRKRRRRIINVLED